MDDSNDATTSNENENENVAQTEETIEDTDADTRDEVDTTNDDFVTLLRRMNTMEEVMERLAGNLEALRNAQGILVENGATVQDFDDSNMDLNDDSFISPAELDLLI